MAGLKLDDVKVVWVLLKKNINFFWKINNITIFTSCFYLKNYLGSFKFTYDKLCNESSPAAHTHNIYRGIWQTLNALFLKCKKH